MNKTSPESISKKNTRMIALDTLLQVEKGGYANKILSELSETHENLDSSDVRFTTRLVYGVLEKRRTIDYIISQFVKKPLKSMERLVLYVLRLGVYQIVYMDSVPQSAACDESVKLVKKKKHPKSVAFVNAVLRNICRNPDVWTDVEKKDASCFRSVRESYAIKFSLPEWLVDRWMSQPQFLQDKQDVQDRQEMQKGQEKLEKLEKVLCGLSGTNLFWVRVNKLKVTHANAKALLESAGYAVENRQNKSDDSLNICEDYYLINNPTGIVRTEFFKSGTVYVQNPSSALPIKLLNPRENEKILDICAAPGGKTTLIADATNNQCNILACDVSEDKIKLINANCKRLGVKCVKTQVMDATVFDNNLAEEFDKVLVDAPCSGTGSMGSKPDIKWRLKQKDFEKLNDIQYRILCNAASYVRMGGCLVYSTCSIDEDENSLLIRRFLSEHNEFTACNVSGETCDLKAAEFCIYPNQNESGLDGFYAIKLIRQTSSA